MCRMVLAPGGIEGRALIGPFLRMARGENASHERSSTPGGFRHPDGWGAVIERGGRFVRLRSTLACWDDPDFHEVGESPVYLLHARRASTGAVRLENTHPFERTVAGKPRFFCHNGTIRDPLPRPSWAEGETDSEAYFARLLGALDHGDRLTGVASLVETLADFTSLNAYLLAPDEAIVLCAWSMLPTYFTLHRLARGKETLFSSEPLLELGDGWEPLRCGEIDRVDIETGRVTQTQVPLARG